MMFDYPANKPEGGYLRRLALILVGISLAVFMGIFVWNEVDWAQRAYEKGLDLTDDLGLGPVSPQPSTLISGLIYGVMLGFLIAVFLLMIDLLIRLHARYKRRA